MTEGVVTKGELYLMIIRGEGEEYLPGVLTLPGGKVEEAGDIPRVLEETVRREIREETGVEVHPEMVYLESKSFGALGDRVIDVVFMCRYLSGTPTIADPGEVAAIHWMTAEQVFEHSKTPEWTRRSIELAEERRGGEALRDEVTRERDNESTR
jgi:ADP-ribose pyrophosphatase YjhB (NUDIX family)